jgi:hypothetical protein
MKKTPRSVRQLRASALAAGVAVLALPALGHATVVWTATMEKGDLSEWTSQTNGTKVLDGGVRVNIAASTEKPYTGNYSCKVTVHPDDDFGQYHQDRADTKHVSTLTGEGKDSYLSGYYFLPEDAKTRDEIAFYETMVSSRNWMDLWVEPKAGGGTTVKFGIESQGANLGSVLVWMGDWQAGVWHQFAIHVHWSIDKTKGVVDIWIDGKQVVTGYKHQTKYDTNDMFFQTGIHRVLMQPYTETLYIDDFIEGDAQDDMKIAAPGLGGGGTGDGGTDAASSTGAGGSAGATGAAGAGGTTGAAGAAMTTGAAGDTGAAGSNATGAAGASTGSGGTGTTTGAAGSGTMTGAAGVTATGAGGNHGHSSSGCGIAGRSNVGFGSILLLLGAAIAARRRRY